MASAGNSGFTIAPAVALSGLTENSTYFYAVQAEKHFGEPTVLPGPTGDPEVRGWFALAAEEPVDVIGLLLAGTIASALLGEPELLITSGSQQAADLINYLQLRWAKDFESVTAAMVERWWEACP